MYLLAIKHSKNRKTQIMLDLITVALLEQNFFLIMSIHPDILELQMHFARSVKNLHVDFDFPKERYAHIKGKKISL